MILYFGLGQLCAIKWPVMRKAGAEKEILKVCKQVRLLSQFLGKLANGCQAPHKIVPGDEVTKIHDYKNYSLMLNANYTCSNNTIIQNSTSVVTVHVI